MSRNEILEMARRATANDPVQVVSYTESELAEQLALVELRRLAAKWHRQNARERSARAQAESSEQPFPLTRPALRGKVANRPRVSAIGNFFQTVAIFLCQ